MRTGVENSECPSPKRARSDSDQRTGIERAQTIARADFGEIAGQCRDHQHGFQPLTQQDNGGLNESVGHDGHPDLIAFLCQIGRVG